MIREVSEKSAYDMHKIWIPSSKNLYTYRIMSMEEYNHPQIPYADYSNTVATSLVQADVRRGR